MGRLLEFLRYSRIRVRKEITKGEGIACPEANLVPVAYVTTWGLGFGNRINYSFSEGLRKWPTSP